MMETIGFLELNSIAKGVEVADIVLKTAAVSLIFSRAGCPGKYYLLFCFKDRYGMTINAYLNQARVTWVKQQLRFTDKTVETLAAELQIEPAYLSRLFKKVEGVSPTSFRKSWRGK